MRADVDVGCLDRGVNDIVLPKGRSLLQHAIMKRMPELALPILAHPEFDQVNKRDFLGITALHAAAALGYVDVCRAILARGDFIEVLAEGDKLPGTEQKTLIRSAVCRRPASKG